MARILVVDDETSMQEFLGILLQRDGHETTTCGSADQALVALESDDWDLVISDVRMPGMSGLELLDRVRELSPETTVILITAHGTTESAVEAMKHGAYDYLTKPCSVDEIRLVVDKALEKRELAHENQRLRLQLRDQSAIPTIVGKTARMQEIFGLVRQIAPTRANILITGESGTGKELIARAIHNLSERRDAAFVAVNCGAIPENLLESELFGHVKGSFTGASANKPGLFEVANGGTIFLDEIGDMDLSLQVKVLRAIQQRAFQRVGGTSEVHVDVRIVCSTNRRLEQEVREGRFREDLFYRLNVIEISLPPLRERIEDLPQLIHHFMEKFSAELGKDVRELEPEVLPALEAYAFPGNVRELENIVERAVTLARTSRITLECLPESVRRPVAAQGPDKRIPEAGVSLDALLAAYETSLIQEALQRCGGVKKRAASLLGVTFRSLRYRLEKLQMEDPEPQ
ncbi:MAG: sigma-54-dependent Fis family transcriptional regulator [Deltaproteobacteria bacterium]|nr:sigma-54-dependent Fis family transcriptional regulator [Deltaproteobacteria bacterium]